MEKMSDCLTDPNQAGTFYRNRFAKQSSTNILRVKQIDKTSANACEKYSVFVVFSFAAEKDSPHLSGR
ncbi:MAG TPA: hypothetical protein VK400_16735 [Pyrinomonadaceae bacterium]|nr:hypothetical protein [Pyrinomonadaceae bacterium]